MDLPDGLTLPVFSKNQHGLLCSASTAPARPAHAFLPLVSERPLPTPRVFCHLQHSLKSGAARVFSQGCSSQDCVRGPPPGLRPRRRPPGLQCTNGCCEGSSAATMTTRALSLTYFCWTHPPTAHSDKHGASRQSRQLWTEGTGLGGAHGEGPSARTGSCTEPRGGSGPGLGDTHLAPVTRLPAPC